MSTTASDAETSPQFELERLVQDRARHLDTDGDPTRLEGELTALVDEEIRRWNDDHRRGIRERPLEPTEAVAARALRNLAHYGPLTSLLDDDDVWEIMINAPDLIFVRRHVGHSGYHAEVFHDDDHLVRTITRLLDNATGSHRKLDPTEGLQDAQLEDGARVHIVHDDISRGGHLLINIRKFTGVAYRSLDELVANDMFDRSTAAFLRAAVRADCSIIFAGAPGAGKTTLLSCCAAELDPSRRVVTAEEVFETQIPLPNVASMQTRPARSERPAIDLRRLVAGFLRMAPDVAVVGEVRDREALALLLTLSSGVTGFTTIHAGSARRALTRLRFICQLAPEAEQLPIGALNALVADSIDLVVFSTQGATGPRVQEVLAVEDLVAASDAAQFTTTTVFERAVPDGPLEWSGSVPTRLRDRFRRAGIDLMELVQPGRHEPERWT